MTDSRATPYRAAEVVAHWDGFVEWFEDDGETIVCRFMDVDKPLPEMLAAIPRDKFEQGPGELLVGTYVEWFIAEGSGPRVKYVPPLTEEEIAFAHAEAERMMEAFADE